METSRWLPSWRDLEKPVSVQSLAVFRILFGLLMCGAMVRLLALGWVDELFVRPSFHFTYPGFGWVHPFAAKWMHGEVVALAACALGMAAGFQYRLCTGLFLTGFLHLELIDQTTYLNHYYLVTLLCGLMLSLPANGAYSIDAKRDRNVRRSTVPAWMVSLLRFQVGAVYFFAGVAKLNADWLLRAQPLRLWLPIHSDLPLVGAFLSEPWVACAASWFGAVFDLSIPFLLRIPRLRFPAYLMAALFHVFTWLLFNIGMFPWIMMVSALVFFPPDWPGRWLGRCDEVATSNRMPRWQAALIGAYVLAQIVIPLRGFFYSGVNAWSCDGFNFAWKVMVVEKTGYADFYVVDPHAEGRQRINVSDYLTPRQAVMMAQDPHLIRDMARYLATKLGGAIYVDAFATLNGRPSQRIIRADVNLAGELPADWIIPLTE